MPRRQCLMTCMIASLRAETRCAFTELSHPFPMAPVPPWKGAFSRDFVPVLVWRSTAVRTPVQFNIDIIYHVQSVSKWTFRASECCDLGPGSMERGSLSLLSLSVYVMSPFFLMVSWLVVWNILYFAIYWESSSQLTNAYFSEG